MTSFSGHHPPQQRQLSSATLHYLLSLTDLLVVELVASFRFFCKQQQQQQRRQQMEKKQNTVVVIGKDEEEEGQPGLLKEVHTVVVRRLKRRLWLELQEVFEKRRTYSLFSALDLDANRTSASDLSHSPKTAAAAAEEVSPRNGGPVLEEPQSPSQGPNKVKQPLLSRLSFRRKMNKGKWPFLCLQFHHHQPVNQSVEHPKLAPGQN